MHRGLPGDSPCSQLEECLIVLVRMRCAVEGVLKGYDQLLNLVLDETVEYARGEPLVDTRMRPPPHCLQGLIMACCLQMLRTCSGSRTKRAHWALW